MRNIGDFAFALVVAVAGAVAVSSVPGGGAAMETMVISSFGFPSMLVTRFLYGKDWYKKDLNRQDAAVKGS